MNMSYETFKEQINRDIKEYVKEKYPEASTTCMKAYRINEAFDVIEISVNSKTTSLEIEWMYDKYCKGEKKDYQDLISYIYGIIDSNIQVTSTEEFNCVKEDIKKDQIVFYLINTEKNKDFLKTLPHRDFLDLSIIYMYLPCEGMEVLIDNDICQYFELNEKELYQLAKENTKRLYDFKYLNCYETLKLNLPFEFFKKTFGKIKNPDILGCWLRAKDYYCGSSGLLYDEILEELSKKFNGNFYIVPSSIYECIIYDAASKDIEFLKNLIVDQNKKLISIHDFLSDSLYFYSANRKKIEIVE